MGLIYSDSVITARITAVRNLIDAGSAGGTIEIGTTGMASVLIVFGLSDPCGGISGNALAFTSPLTAFADNTGTPVEARIKDSDGNIVVSGLEVGVDIACPDLVDGNKYILTDFSLVEETPVVEEQSVWGDSAIGPWYGVTQEGTVVGVKFQSTIAGSITGIRFYQVSAGTGHVGALWESDGSLLDSKSFTGETGSGWQEVRFDTPVSIAANTTYIASVLMPGGQEFAETPQFLLTNGIENGRLRILPTGEDGVNGVYILSDTNTFPSLDTFTAAYTWVDILFTE